jgi:16S rRNA (cytosine1402-N4)-methyltransferase
MKKYKPKSGEKIEHKEEIIPPKVELPFEFSPEHYPVLLQEVLAAFYPFRSKKNPTYFDGTFGRGGHYSAVKYTVPQMVATVTDQDLAAIEFAKTKFKTEVEQGQLNIIHGNFSQFSEYNLKNFDMMVLDLGVSSPQLDQAERGFSFYHDGPLESNTRANGGSFSEHGFRRGFTSNFSRVWRSLQARSGC